MNLRYFIISYIFGNGSLGTGVYGFKSMYYPNIHEVRKLIDVKGVSIMNILEVIEEDYKQFWKKENESE